MTTGAVHRPVMLREALDALALREGDAALDATFGRGGHARAMLERIGADGELHVFDRDPDAIRVASALAAEDPRITVHHRPFAELRDALEGSRCWGGFRGVLMDLGVSSPQLDESERGFSFSQDGPLDMRMGAGCAMSAAEWVAKTPEAEMAKAFFEYGEERYSRRIAAAIAREREEAPIDRTGRLADVVSQAHPAWERDRHPATRVFMAIRLVINDELGQVREALGQAVEALAPGGRLAVISFHSLEDRIVKRFMRDEERGDPQLGRLPLREVERATRLKRIGGAQRPGAEEVRENPRARSAVLRVAERTAAEARA